MKIALAQQNYYIGNFEINTQKIIEAIRQAKQQGAELVVFSELCICGYPPRDFLEFNDFIDKCSDSVDKIAKETNDIGVIIGAPLRNPHIEGKDLFNGAWLLYKGKVQEVIHKTLLPTYDIFDENRYFEPASEWNIITFKGKKIALTICEDIWNLGDNPLYRICPMDILMEQAPEIIINISASPFDYYHDEDRKEIIRANVLKYKLPLIYCNAVGAQTEVIFDGGSLVFDRSGKEVCELAYFKEDFQLVETAVLEAALAADENAFSRLPAHQRQFVPQSQMQESASSQTETFSLLNPSPTPPHGEYIADLNIDRIHHALILGIRDYFSKMNFTQAILGSSGGIDSGVAIALACEALGAENVRTILMPSPYSSTHSVDDARKLSENLGNPYEIVRIDKIYQSFLNMLEPLFEGTSFGIAEENIQARTRGNLLMAIANKFNLILLNTSNKSELAVGYGTLYGDMAGGLSLLGDLYKTQVYELAKYINRNQEIIPVSILSKAPSAELRPDQKDSDSLPDYAVLDEVLYQYIEMRQGPNEIKKRGFDAALVDRALRLVNINEYKRNQFCPIIRVSAKAFGVGRRVPIVGKYLS